MSTTATKKVVRKSAKNPASRVRHALEELIPDPSYGEGYVSRKVAGGVRDAKQLAVARMTRDNVLIEGPTGSAKTSLVLAYASGFVGDVDDDGKPIIDRSKAMPLVTVACSSGITPDQLWGGPVAVGDSFEFVPGDGLIVVITGGVLYFDEVNFMSPRITSTSHPLLDKRRMVIVPDARGAGMCCKCALVNGATAYNKARKSMGDPLFTCRGCGHVNYTDTVFKAHDDLQIVAAYNKGYRGTTQLNEAFLNRFSMSIEFPYDREVEQELLYSGRLIDVAFQLRKSYADREITTPVSTSMLMDFEAFALHEDLGFAFAVENFLMKFDPSERQAVTNVLSSNAQAIMADLIDEEEEEEEPTGITFTQEELEDLSNDELTVIAEAHGINVRPAGGRFSRPRAIRSILAAQLLAANEEEDVDSGVEDPLDLLDD